MKKIPKAECTGADSPAAPAAKAFFRKLAGLLLMGVLFAVLIGCGTRMDDQPRNTGLETAPSQTSDSTAPPKTEAPTTTAAPDPYSCGEHLTWSFDRNTGLLTIVGSGAMTDYDNAEAAPWHSDRSSISAISLPEGLTHVGDCSFASCFNLSRVFFPDGTASIGDHAFQWCSKLSFVVFPEGLTEIGASAFQGCGLTSLPVTLPESVAVIGDHAFANSSGLEEIRILNQNCAIGGSLAASSLTTICGFTGSTAEQYADQGGYVFTPITVMELDPVAEWVAKDNEERSGLDGDWKEAFGGVTTIEGVGLIGGRRLAKIVRTVGITASEEEIAQAKQDRLITLHGERYSYRETQEEFELTYGTSIPYTVKEDGFIYLQNGGRILYDVGRVGNSFVFAYDWGDSWSRLEEVTDVAWVLLDESTVWTIGTKAYIWTETELWPFLYKTINDIQIGSDDAVQIDCAEKGKA